MKVISLPQPQAFLLSVGVLKFVSAAWPDKDYRGPVKIYATDVDQVTAAHPLVMAEVIRVIGEKGLQELATNAIVGEGKIQDCIDNNHFPNIPDQIEFACNHNIPGGEACMEVVETQQVDPIPCVAGPGCMWDMEEGEHTGFEETTKKVVGPVKLEQGHLPEGFPGKAALDEAGYNTFHKVRKLRHEGNLTSVTGVGPATATLIEKALDKTGSDEQVETAQAPLYSKESTEKE